jgi:hypothetical protein
MSKTFLGEVFRKEHSGKKPNSAWKDVEDDNAAGTGPTTVSKSPLRNPLNIFQSRRDR